MSDTMYGSIRYDIDNNNDGPNGYDDEFYDGMITTCDDSCNNGHYFHHYQQDHAMRPLSKY